MFPSLRTEGALMNGRHPDLLDAPSVHTHITASFLAEGALIHEIGTISAHQTSAIKN